MMVRIISWRWQGRDCVLDVGEEHDARAIAIALAELGREDVRLSRVEVEEPPGLRERIWERVRQRLAEPPPEVLKA